MNDTTTAPAAFTTGPAAYLLTVAQLGSEADPYLMLQCTHWREQPQQCGNLLADQPASLDITALLDAALEHDLSHRHPDRAAVYKYACELDDLYGRYTVDAVDDEPPFLGMACPYGRPSGIYCPGPKDPKEDRECVANLLSKRPSGATIGTLLELAAEHEDGRARVIAAQFAPELAARHIAEAGVAAGREVAEARRRQQDAEDRCNRFVARIGDVRRAWAKVQQSENYTRETSDGPNAGAASVRSDLIGRMLADIDRAMTGG